MKYVLQMTREEILTLDLALRIARSEYQRLKSDEARRFKELHKMVTTALLQPED